MEENKKQNMSTLEKIAVVATIVLFLGGGFLLIFKEDYLPYFGISFYYFFALICFARPSLFVDIIYKDKEVDDELKKHLTSGFRFGSIIMMAFASGLIYFLLFF